MCFALDGTLANKWNNAGCFQQLYIRSLRNSDVYLVFESYYPQSSLGVTQSVSAETVGSRQHKLSSHMPLPPQKIRITVVENKVQLIDLIYRSVK